MHLTDLLIKDMKNILYDVKSLAIIILMPVVLMSILGISLQGVFGESNGTDEALAKVGIVKKYDFEMEMEKVKGRVDLQSYDEEIIEGLNAEKNFFSLMDNQELSDFLQYELMSQEEGMAALDANEINALIILPKNFIYNNYMMLYGSRLVSDIDYYFNPENDFYAGIILSIIESYSEMNNQIYGQQRLLTMKLMFSGNSDALDSIDGMMDMAIAEEADIDIDVQGVQRVESINSFQYYSAAIMCMFLLYTAGIGGRALLEERRGGTIPRLAVGGYGIGIAVVSNFLRVMLLAMTQSAVMIVYSDLVLNVDWGNPMTVTITVVISSFTVAAIGMLVGVMTLMAGNYKAANAFEFGIVYIMALVGGSFIPVEGLPKILQRLGFLSVNGQALQMYINGMYRLPVTESLTSVSVMFVLGMTFIVIAMLLIRSKGGELAC